MTADLVVNALSDPSLVHIFGDTTLEFPSTVDYAHRYRDTHPEAIFQIARRLREIAFLSMDAQETDNAAHWQAVLHALGEQAASLAELTGLPKYQPPAETGLVPVPAAKTRESALILQMEDDGTERLRAEVRALRELLASLVLERDNLVNIELRVSRLRRPFPGGRREAGVHSDEKQ